MTRRKLIIGVAILLAMATSGRLLAQNGLTLPAWSVDSGGGTLSGATFTLDATVGQPDAGVLSGGTFTLYGGLWGPEAPSSGTEQDTIFLPAITTE